MCPQELPAEPRIIEEGRFPTNRSFAAFRLYGAIGRILWHSAQPVRRERQKPQKSKTTTGAACEHAAPEVVSEPGSAPWNRVFYTERPDGVRLPGTRRSAGVWSAGIRGLWFVAVPRYGTNQLTAGTAGTAAGRTTAARRRRGAAVVAHALARSRAARARVHGLAARVGLAATATAAADHETKRSDESDGQEDVPHLCFLPR